MSKNTYIFSNTKNDLVSGLIVFLIALPLCLGIAQASGASPFSGIIAGVVGGIVIGYLSGSQLSVSGPAAGLVAIVLGAMQELQLFEIFFCVVIIAGVIQLLLGFIKAGSIANYFPTSVIEGMLAGIGLTIIIKQIPDGVGYVNPQHTAGMQDSEAGGFVLSDLTNALNHIEIGGVIICIISIAILALWQTKKMSKFKLIPAGLLVVVIGTIINEIFKVVKPELYLAADHLVKLPVPESVGAFFAQFTFPDFNGFFNPAVWKYGVIIAVVASIETLLCIEATDKLDPLKRYSSGNRELRAQGIGNMVSGLIGGLPITSVIVRSSANINAGGRTKLATITHGVLLLVCVAMIPGILNLIPKASLAAILIFTGYRLARPAVVKHMWHAGLAQFVPFIVTAIAVVALDLLKGVGIGMMISIFYLLRNNLRVPFFYQHSKYKEGKEVVKLELAQELSFLNKASIKQVLDNIPKGSSIILDASNTAYIDYDVLELIKEFHATKAPDKNIQMSLVGFKNTYNLPEKLESLNPIDVTPQDVNPIDKTAGGYKKLMKKLNEIKV